VLFACTGNAGRSQLAQALFRQLAGERVEVESAGVAPWPHVHPMAVRMMVERGINMAGHYPKPVAMLAGRAFDLVITIGEPARGGLPAQFKERGQWVHWDVPDPAAADGTDESEAIFRHTAEEIASRLPELLDMLGA